MATLLGSPTKKRVNYRVPSEVVQSSGVGSLMRSQDSIHCLEDLAPGRKFQHETTFKELYPSKAGELGCPGGDSLGTHDLHSPSRAAQPAAGR